MGKGHIGENIRKARDLKGLTQDQLSRLIVVSRTTISNYENNGRVPGFRLKAIWKHLEMDPERLESILAGIASDVHQNYPAFKKNEEEKDREIAKLRKENAQQKSLIVHQGARLAWINKKQKGYYMQNKALEKKLKALEKKYARLMKKHEAQAKAARRK